MTRDAIAMPTAARLSALLALTSLLGCGAAALADDLATNAPAASSTSTASARDQLYEELAADVAELEQRGSVLKRVVKLVKPAVVHIEARRETEGSRPARG